MIMKQLIALTLAVAFCASALFADDTKAKAPEGGKLTTTTKTSCHGTAIEFVENPQEAARLATAQKKLVFVLHVSGYFEDPNFT
jgi:hypothetical protein